MTSILLVVKTSLYQTNLPIFLTSFILFNARTSVQPFQVIIISAVYYSSSGVLWSFCFNLRIFLLLSGFFTLICSVFIDPENCPQVCSQILCGPYPNSACVFSSHAGFGRSWWGWWLVVHTCLHQFIALLNLKSSLGSLFNPSFVDWLLVCISCIGSVLIDPGTCPQVC